jgi:hypothetical protein
MKRREFEETAKILGGRFKAGVWGVKAPVISGKLPDGRYTITWKWEVETHRKGLLRRKKQEAARQFVFSLRSTWTERPLNIAATKRNGVAVTSAVPGQSSQLTDTQLQVLQEAVQIWPDLRITNHGFELTASDTDQTAQEIAVIHQGLAAMLESLDETPPKESRFRRVIRFRSGG